MKGLSVKIQLEIVELLNITFRNDFIPLLCAVKTYISGILSALLVATDITR